MADNLYVVRSLVVAEKPPGSPMKIAADERGRVLFRDPVEPQKVKDSLGRYVEMAKNAAVEADSKAREFSISEITLKLGIDAEVGCILIGDASVKASIEVKLTRRPLLPNCP